MTASNQAKQARNAREKASYAWDGQRNGLSQWEYDGDPPVHDRRTSSIIVTQWERETGPAWRKVLDKTWQRARGSYRMIAIASFSFMLGFAVSSGPKSAIANFKLRDRLVASHNSLSAREGELELARLELGRLSTVMENSQRYHIPADLAAKIYDMALAEGIEPRVAFSLVSVESEFAHKAISPVGALGLTQLMPSTARFFDPTINRSDLFDPETNLRIGFRFLKELIGKYDGNVDRALHAYNRGPGIVDRIVESGGNPANGYADAVMNGAK